MAHTCNSEEAWWEVQLAQRTVIDYITIYNRNDPWKYRMEKVVLQLYDGSNLVDSKALSGLWQDVAGDVFSVDFDNVVATKVKLYKNHIGNQPINFRELEAWGTIVPPPGSFEIHSTGNITGTATSGTTIEILAPYNASSREHNTTVLSADCITPFTGTAADAFTVTTTADVPSGDGFIAYNSTIVVDISKVNNTAYWNELSDGAMGGVFDVCLESAVYFVLPAPDNKQEKMNFVNTNLTLTVEMDANFEVTTINAERKDAKQEEVRVDYSDYVEAYECVESDLVNKANNQEYSQGDELKICVKSKNPSIVQVDGIQRLTLSQDVDTTTDDFTYITGGSPVSSEIAATDCDKSISPNVCHADMQLLGRYFEDESPGELTATGSVELSFSGGSRRLTVDVPIAGGIRGGDLALENSARHMEEEKPDDSLFDVVVSLTSLEESGGTNDFNGATLLSGMVAAVGGAILMV